MLSVQLLCRRTSSAPGVATPLSRYKTGIAGNAKMVIGSILALTLWCEPPLSEIYWDWLNMRLQD
jgi:hypothetical protein